MLNLIGHCLILGAITDLEELSCQFDLLTVHLTDVKTWTGKKEIKKSDEKEERNKKGRIRKSDTNSER